MFFFFQAEDGIRDTSVTGVQTCALPIFATGWSGNMDFMNVSNSYPVRYDLVRIEKSVGPYQAGETWAEPSTEHAADRKSTRLNSSHRCISYAVFCLKKKNKISYQTSANS